MSNLKIISKDNNYIVECVHCNGTGFCENYVNLYRTEIKKFDSTKASFIFNFSYYCKLCGKNSEIKDSVIETFDSSYNHIHNNLFFNSDKFLNISKFDFEKYLQKNLQLNIETRFDYSEKPQNLICNLCSGKGYNII